MRSFDVQVDVTARTNLPGELHTTATVVAPSLPDDEAGEVTVLFGFPGGGYGRRYYDIRTRPGYSQALHHGAQGFVFAACDPLMVGDSSQPEPFSLTYENLAAANHATVESIVGQLREGCLAPGLAPLPVTKVVGMGQSMGGCLLTVQQADHRSFDGVVFMGWSGIFTNFPSPSGERISYAMPPRGTDLAPIADQLFGIVSPEPDQYRFCFHYPDEDPALSEPDLASYVPYSGVKRGDETTPWGSATLPPCAITMMTPGTVAEEAARIAVPVLVVSGERDTIPDPWLEPTAYRGSPDVAVAVFPRMSHMHNFATTRALLWDRIAAFARAVPAGAASTVAIGSDTEARP